VVIDTLFLRLESIYSLLILIYIGWVLWMICMLYCNYSTRNCFDVTFKINVFIQVRSRIITLWNVCW